MRYKNPITLGLLALGLALSGCGDDDSGTPAPQPDSGETDPEEPGNLVEVATAAGLTALVDALEKVGLDETVATTENLTVFAPSNEALEAATLPEDSDLLANILLHHVIGSRLDSDDVLAAETLTTLAKTNLPKDGSTINGVDISSGQLDVEASNGIAHVINGVFVPPNILEQAAATEDLSTLASIVTSSASQAIRDVLSGPGPITVFAPNNAAFEALLTALEGELPEEAVIDQILSYHVVSGQVLSNDLESGSITTEQGAELSVNVDDDTITLTDGQDNTVNITETFDLRLLNGVVHVIDGVLLPPDEPGDGESSDDY